MNFKGKVVIITGGSQGIGMAISLAFARSGAFVVIADIDVTAGKEHLEHLKSFDSQAMFVPTDISRESDVQHLAETVIHHFGSIDIVINNAGIFDRKSIFERTMEEWDQILAVNLRGPYMMAKYCGDALMKANPGVIIHIASTRALMSEADTEPYSASKGGILALTHSLAVSLAPKVRVNAISPGWIEVSNWKKTSARKVPIHSLRDKEQHLVGRVGKPEDIAEICLFLASEKAGFISGANFVIDGGMTVKMIYEE